MGLNLFGRGRKAASKPQPKTYAPGSRISYDPALISRFKGHHVTLLKLFGELSKSTENREYGKIRDKLSAFKRVLEQHLLEENLRFYVYLDKCLAGDPDNAEMAMDMKREMGAIGRTVNQFIRHYVDFGVTDGNIVKFSDELQTIGATLVDRIKREESSLYTLYLPPDDYL